MPCSGLAATPPIATMRSTGYPLRQTQRAERLELLAKISGTSCFALGRQKQSECPRRGLHDDSRRMRPDSMSPAELLACCCGSRFQPIMLEPHAFEKLNESWKIPRSGKAKPPLQLIEAQSRGLKKSPEFPASRSAILPLTFGQNALQKAGRRKYEIVAGKVWRIDQQA